MLALLMIIKELKRINEGLDYLSRIKNNSKAVIPEIELVPISEKAPKRTEEQRKRIADGAKKAWEARKKKTATSETD